MTYGNLNEIENTIYVHKVLKSNFRCVVCLILVVYKGLLTTSLGT